MKSWFRFLLGASFALLAAIAQAQSLTPTNVSTSSVTGLPGSAVKVTITVSNSVTTDFTGKAAFSVKFTHVKTGSNFTLTTAGQISPVGGLVSKGVVDPTTNQTTPGTGSFEFNTTIPYQVAQEGGHIAEVTLTAITGATGVTNSTFTTPAAALTVNGKPDLEITALSYSAGTAYVGGTVIPMSLTFRNNQTTNGNGNVPYTPGNNGQSAYVRIQVVLSSNPTFGDADDFQLTIHDISANNFGSNLTTDNAGNSALLADNSLHTFSWNQILPGNFVGSYYVLAKIDSLTPEQLPENDPPLLTVNGNNVWGGNTLNPAGTLINLLPSNFPTIYTASHATGAATTANGYSDNPSMTADGRFVVFASDANNLIASDTNGVRDVFIFDSQTSQVRRLSVSQQGIQANGASNNPAISATDGRYVAFASDATNLVIGDTNGFSDIFVVDTLTGILTKVSGANASGGQANNPSFRPKISQDGRYVVFESSATNLTATATTAGRSHIYLYDRTANTTTLIDVSTAGAEGNGNSIQAAISADGSMVAWASDATNLVATDTNGKRDVFVRTLATSTTKLVSVVTTTAAQGDNDSQTPSLSSDGRWVAFASLATNLLGAGVDTNGVSDIFVYDNNAAVATPAVVRVSVTKAGAQATDPSAAGFQLGSINPTISADGRYVAFASLANNLTSGDTNGQSQTNDANASLDVFVRDRQVSGSGAFDVLANSTTQMVSVNAFGYQTNGLLGVPSTPASNIYPVISANGRFVALPSDAENNAGLAFGATNLLPLDSNALRDVFLFDRRTNASVTPSTPPTVTITSPGNGSTALVNTAIQMTASATTTLGVVSSVQFFVNGTSLGTSTVFPYSATWTPTAVGTYTLSALVTDSFGNIGVSSNVRVTVNAAPSVGITAPTPTTALVVGTATTISGSAAASNPNAKISAVQVFVNNSAITPVTLVDTSTGTVPFSSVSFSVPHTFAASGNYTITARATDDAGTPADSGAVLVSVAPAGGGGGGGSGLTLPVLTSLSPANGTSVTLNFPQTVSVNASLAGGTISRVTFTADGTTIGTSNAAPYSVQWTPTSTGTYSITATALGSNGASATSTSVVTVTAGTVPTASVDLPGTGATLSVNTVQTIAATATAKAANSSITKVDFFVNGVSIASDSTFPYTANWTPTSAGTYALYVRATDSLGSVFDSPVVNVTVSSGSAPSVGISSPLTSSTVSVGTVTPVVATATAVSGTIASVELFANNVSVGIDTTFPYNFSWTPTGVGVVSLTAVATDSLGNRAVSGTTSVTVAGFSPGAPSVALTAPLGGASIPVGVSTLIAASASDSDGTIAQVEFFANGVSLGVDTVFPYNVSFTPGATGSYVITARATDNAGNVTTSTAVNVTVSGGAAPTVAITSPSNLGTVGVNTPQTITATATSTTGFIAKVEFLLNGVSLSVDSAFPYSTTWTPGAVGNYTLTARATDNLGNITDSAVVAVTVAASAPPTVAITNPATGSAYTVGTPLTIAATAADSDGLITQVQFFVNGVPLSTADLVSPYSAVWAANSVGVYSLTAQATDNNGNVTTSAPVSVTIGANAAPTVALTSPVAGSYSLGNLVLVAASANDSDGSVATVQFFANGLAIGTASSAPFNVSWRPTLAGTYAITAQATDNVGNVTTAGPVNVSITATAAPTITINNPVGGREYGVGNSIPFTATPAGGNGAIAQVQFFVNGATLGAPDTVSPYSAIWTPGAPGTYTLLAIATDSAGLSSSSSAALNITVNGNNPPAVALSGPPTGTSVNGGTPVNLSAVASDADGTVATVRFIANGNVVGSATALPYGATWVPSAAGTYTVIAEATDNSGNVTTSAPVSVSVISNRAPTVVLSGPSNGSTARVGSATNLTATATDSDGTIASVQFFANGVLVGAADTTAPYTATWTPGAEGIYRITAQALDNSGATALSSEITVLAIIPGAKGSDVIYSGNYAGLGESGRFAAINVRGSNATFIGFSTTAPSRIYFYNGMAVDTAGGFAQFDTVGRSLISGTATDTGATGTLDNGRVTFIGAVGFGAGNGVPPGYYVGGITGRPDSTLVAIVSPDGSITLYAADGTFRDAGTGVLASTGSFTVVSQSGVRFAGRADPASGFLTGSITGGPGGSFMAAVASGVSFSDGFLKNLSTRGQVGTGNDVLIAGFVVAGDSPKQVLIRAIGPSLTAFGITGALANPQLQLFTGNTLTTTNDNWGGTAAISTAANQVGAFALGATSLDSAILATLPPGSYTAQVSGVGGTTGVALVELYDVDNLRPFSGQKVTNVATRGVVGPGQAQLIAGFMVSGNTAKKVLIRAVGPTLGRAPFNFPGVLADPQLRLVQGADRIVRDNDSWELGNDVALITEATARVGAFPLAAGSRDAAILINLPPGTYSAQVTGPGTTTGVALVEVYEVP